MIQLGNNLLKGAFCATLPENEKVWFHAEGQAGIPFVKKAKAICNSGCPVKKQCLDLALSTEVHGERYGVYGGLSASERNKNFQSWHKMAGLCRNGLHDMSDPENHIRQPDGVRCKACKKDARAALKVSA